MIHKLIPIEKKISHDDEYDAIACGLTFFAHQKSVYPQA
jgi:Holliday junction resolvasome RuvABC endonuclease subunit